MDRRQLLTGLLAASAAPAIAEGANALSDTGPASTFALTLSTSDIGVTEAFGSTGLLVGESLGLAIEGNGGFTVDNDYADIAIVVDWGDADATFDHSVPTFGNVAATSHGRVVNHSWSTAGTKTVTITGYVYGQAVRQQTLSVTVVDPSSVFWDREWFVSLDGDATGMPTESRRVKRILSSDEYRKLDNTTRAGQKVRIHWRAGTTHQLAAQGTEWWRQNAAILYITSFGTGTRPVIDVSTGKFDPNGYYFTYPRIDGQRVVIDGLELDGGYDPVSGKTPGARLGFYLATNDRCYCSVSNCTFTGLGLGSNVWSANGGMFFYNCTNGQSGMADFVCLSTAKWLVLAGCDFRSHPLSGAGDLKVADTGNPTWPDHALIRSEPSTYAGADNCHFAVHNQGWSPLGPERDQQPAWRYSQTQDTIGTYLASFTRLHITASRAFVFTTGPGNSNMTALGHVVCDGIRHNGTRAAGVFKGILATVNFGGVTVQNTVVAVPDLEWSGARANFDVVQLESSDTGQVSAANHRQPSFFRNITFFSELTYEASKTLNDVKILSGSDWNYTASDNLISGDGHAGSYLASSAFSTGDNFRPVTGGAADSVARGPVPYFDLERTPRGETTNKGAHDGAGPQVHAPAPSHSGSHISIAPVEGSVRQYQVIDLDLANWSNLDPYLIQFTWQVGGDDPAAGGGYAHIPYYRDSGDDSGTITCQIRATTFGGIETADSNTDFST